MSGVWSKLQAIASYLHSPLSVKSTVTTDMSPPTPCTTVSSPQTVDTEATEVEQSMQMTESSITESSTFKKLKRRGPQTTLQSLPLEILLQVIEDYLTPVDHVCLALTNHKYMESVRWALRKPLSLFGPAETPSIKRLFRQNLRDWFGIKFIYCGSTTQKQMHQFLPLKKFANNAHHHKDCDCLRSLEIRASRLQNASPKDKGRAAHQAELKAVLAARDFLQLKCRGRALRR